MVVLRGTGGLLFSIIKETLTMACHYCWIRGKKKKVSSATAFESISG